MSRYRTRLLPFIEQWIRRGTRVAIFGAGPHTDFLFEEVPELAKVNVVGYLESRAAADARFRGLDVHRLSWAEDNADVILCSSYVSECRMAALVEPLDCKILTSHAVCGGQDSGEPGRIHSAWEDLTRSFAQELGAYRRADATSVLTEAERRALTPFLGPERVFVVPNAYPTRLDSPPWEAREGFVFLAGFRHPPNVDAAEYLLDEIMPIVWRAMPDVTVTLLGADVPPTLRARASDRVRVTGFVSDLQPELYRARVAVAPLRYGAGIKGKLCQAFGHGLANVTTSIGAENMALTPNVELLVADTPETFAEAMLRVYRDEALWRELVERGRGYLTRHHAPSLVQSSLLTAMLPPEPQSQTPEFKRIRAYEALAAGLVKVDAGDGEGARELFARATALSPETDVWLTIADAWLRVRREDLGRDALRQAMALAPDDPVPHVAMADALEAEGEPSQSLEILDTLLTQLGKGSVDLRARRARLLTTLGRLAEAAAEWTSLAADNPDDARFRYWVGRSRHASGDHAGAIADYGVALRAALAHEQVAESCAIDRWLQAARAGEPRPTGRMSADVARFRPLMPRLIALGESRHWQPPPCSAELSADLG